MIILSALPGCRWQTSRLYPAWRAAYLAFLSVTCGLSFGSVISGSGSGV